MSVILYDNRVVSGQPEFRVTVPPSQLLVDASIGIVISDGSISATAVGSGVYGLTTPADRNPALDLTFDCTLNDSTNTPDRGKLIVYPTLLGDWISVNIAEDAFAATLSLLGTWGSGIIADGLFVATLTLKPNDDYIYFVSSVKENWIKWSEIGSLDFTIGQGNVAGERPLDWKGLVYAVKKLNNKVVVYGENGISLLVPAGAVFGLNTIYRIGLKGKHAVTGDETKHFFVDSFGKLWKLSDGMQMLDYSEYLSEMTSNIVLTYDKFNNLVYICDGSVGYVYDVVTGSLGKCSPNITGIDYQSGIQYVTASSTIVTDPFEICTDIYDLGVRAGKTIFSLEFGVDLTNDLYAAIDYRRNKAGSFTQTPWYTVSSIGRVFITAYGREFRIRVKTAEYEYFELDYIKVNGVADAY